MKTNELKKGDNVMLSSGWSARIMDNKKGNIRMAEVYGHYTEMGSIYAHDIVQHLADDGTVTLIEHTPAQVKVAKTVGRLFA